MRALATLLALAAVAAATAAAAPASHHEPSLVVPDDMTVEATSRAGATVTYQVQAEAGSGQLALSCQPPSGSVFPLGATLVTCTATDLATGGSTARSFVVRVVDTQPPTLSAAPPNLTLEATSKAGARAAFALPTATDAVDGTVPVTCTVAPGTMVPLGATQVSCRAADSRGNASQVVFALQVRDTRGPVFRRRAPVVRRVNGVTGAPVPFAPPPATDAVDGRVRATCLPAPGTVFRLGRTTVVCRAQDASGNASSTSFVVELLDTVPPPRVAGLAAARTERGVTLTWKPPESGDFAGVVVKRTPGGIVYRGSDTTLTDSTARPGVDYRYDVFSVDRAGNRSPAATATAGEASLLSPPPGSMLVPPYELRWPGVDGADYYNVQLYRSGKKVLSIWPTRNQLRLDTTWTFEGRRQALAPGEYRWYVWPGFGPLAAARYGKLIGTSTFTVAR